MLICTQIHPHLTLYSVHSHIVHKYQFYPHNIFCDVRTQGTMTSAKFSLIWIAKIQKAKKVNFIILTELWRCLFCSINLDMYTPLCSLEKTVKRMSLCFLILSHKIWKKSSVFLLTSKIIGSKEYFQGSAWFFTFL